jgi:hypothetical protein
MRSSTNVSLYKIAHTIAAEKRKDTRNQFLIQMLPRSFPHRRPRLNARVPLRRALCCSAHKKNWRLQLTWRSASFVRPNLISEGKRQDRHHIGAFSVIKIPGTSVLPLCWYMIP